ncbi:hypothetical protein, partial [Herbaspirillum sp. C7C2]|uniref:hypothetical protein n=1 Tax=Herbaspirillum sp. C7C2 TaxID=2736666 RepID=UPI001F51A46D
LETVEQTFDQLAFFALHDDPPADGLLAAFPGERPGCRKAQGCALLCQIKAQRWLFKLRSHGIQHRFSQRSTGALPI